MIETTVRWWCLWGCIVKDWRCLWFSLCALRTWSSSWTIHILNYCNADSFFLGSLTFVYRLLNRTTTLMLLQIKKVCFMWKLLINTVIKLGRRGQIVNIAHRQQRPQLNFHFQFSTLCGMFKVRSVRLLGSVGTVLV